MAISEAQLGHGPVELARIIGSAPPMADVVMQCGSRLTPRWGHGELHDYLGPLNGHIIGTYYGPAQRVSWRSGAERLSSVTKPRSITIVPMGHDGYWDFAGDIGVSYVFLTHERLQRCAEQHSPTSVELIRRVGFDDRIAASLLEVLAREAAAPDASTRLFIEQATDLLCLQLVRGHSSFRALAKERGKRGLAQWQVNEVTSYMREHIDTSLGLEELANLVGLDRFYFLRAFKLATGQTPHDWLVALRMERACALLQRDLKITEVAMAVGYQTPSSFAAAFRSRMAMSPTDYRRQL